MKRIGKVAGVLCAVILAATATASWGAVTATVDRNQLALGDTLRLTFSATGDEDPGDLDLRPLQADFEILQRSNSSNTSYINGEFSSTRELVLDITPRREGTLVIPPLRLGQITTNGIRVTVGAAPQAAADDQSLIFEAELDRASVYVQGQVILTLRLQQAINLDDRNITQLQLENAFVRPLEQNSFQRTVNGRPWLIHEVRYAIFPEQSGTLEIPAQTFSARESAPRRSLFDMGSSGRQLRRSSNPLTIEVLPRPQEFPAAEWLPATDLVLEETWSTPPEQLQVGESATRTITIRGEGLQGAQLPPIMFPPTEGLKYYPDQPVITDSESPAGLLGTRVDSVAVVPTKAGHWKIPAVRIPWWDTRHNELRYAELPARELDVLSGNPTISAPATAALPAPAATVALDPIGSSNPETRGAIANPLWQLFAVVNGIGWLATLGYLLWARRRRPARATNTVDNSNESAALKTLLSACNSGDPAQARRAVLDWARAQTGQVGLASLAQVRAAFDDPALDTALDALDSALYRDEHNNWHGAALAEACRGVRSRSKKTRSAGEPALQLYPQ